MEIVIATDLLFGCLSGDRFEGDSNDRDGRISRALVLQDRGPVTPTLSICFAIHDLLRHSRSCRFAERGDANSDSAGSLNLDHG
jgi:hypothetical protein